MEDLGKVEERETFIWENLGKEAGNDMAKKLGYLFVFFCIFYSFSTSDFLKYLNSKEYFLTIDTSLNRSYLYGSTLSNSIFDLNRVGYNKLHFWIRSFFEQIARVFDFESLSFASAAPELADVGRVGNITLFFWMLPLAFLGFVTSFKKLSQTKLSLFVLFLILSAIKGTGGIIFLLPWILYFDIEFLILIYKKYVTKK